MVNWTIGTRVAVDSRACEEDSLEYAGLVGTVEETFEGGAAVRFDIDRDAGTLDFGAEELCEARGFMPGATEMQLFAKLAGRKVLYYRDMAECVDEVDVKPDREARRWFRVERRDDPRFDQVHFVSSYGFKAIYLDAIVGVK